MDLKINEFLTHQHTPSNNLIDAFFKEDWVFLEIVLHFCKESLLLLISEVK